MSTETKPADNDSPAVTAIVIVMGVSGCGKSTIGALLASRLRWEFEDADWGKLSEPMRAAFATSPTAPFPLAGDR